MDGVEPRAAIGFREGNASVHLLFIGRGVKIVGFEEQVAEAGGEELGDGGFAGTGDAHNEENHGSGERVVEDEAMGC